MEKRAHSRLGALLMILSTLGFAVMQMIISLSKDQLTMAQQLLFRNLICLLLGLFLCRVQKVPCFGTLEQQPALLARSVSGFLGMLSLFYASAHARQADVSIIVRLNPFFVALFAVPLLHERITRRQLLALGVAFAGALLVCNPRMNSNWIPLVFALMNAIFSAFAFSMLAYMKDKAHSMTIITHFSALSCFCSIVWVFWENSSWDAVWQNLPALIGIGLSAGVGQLGVTYAYRLAPAIEISILNYFGIPFSLFLGWFFLRETVPAASLAGAALVVAGAWFSVERQPKAVPRNIGRTP